MKHLLVATLVLSSMQAFSGIDRVIPEKEDTSKLLGGMKEIISLKEMQTLNLNSGKAELDLWSSSYWPTYRGGIGTRYREPLFQQLIQSKAQFEEHQTAFSANPWYRIDRNNLSPAEKYDLLVGDPLKSMTTYAWGKGVETQRNGKVPTWRGLCDGWAQASQVMPRPRKAVTLIAADGKPITFYPEDIKALGVQLYARATKDVVFLGKRCNSRLTGGCTPFNAGAYHKALVNRVGLQKLSFNNDISTSKEVWNYPVESYKMKFYNVLSGNEFDSYQDAIEFYDGSRRFQSRNKITDGTTYLLGVKAEVVYPEMTEAHLLETDSTAQDEKLVKNLKYRLELNSSHEILGGEWISNGVDFVWRATDGAYPLSYSERKKSPETKEEIITAAQASAQRGQPLTMIVKELFERSK